MQASRKRSHQIRHGRVAHAIAVFSTHPNPPANQLPKHLQIYLGRFLRHSQKSHHLHGFHGPMHRGSHPCQVNTRARQARDSRMRHRQGSTNAGGILGLALQGRCHHSLDTLHPSSLRKLARYRLHGFHTIVGSKGAFPIKNQRVRQYVLHGRLRLRRRVAHLPPRRKPHSRFYLMMTHSYPQRYKMLEYKKNLFFKSDTRDLTAGAT